MNDQIFLRRMEFEGRHGVTEEERAEPQTIELDVELRLDLRAAGRSDDLAQTVDYGDVFEICRAQVEQHTYHLLEGLAEAIATDILGRFPDVGSVVVRAMKPGVPLDGVVELAGVGIERSRGD
jgi:dihydroneopterin aldolase